MLKLKFLNKIVNIGNIGEKRGWRNFINFVVIFYIFWLFILPVIFPKIVSVVCENVSHNSAYQINIEKPRIKTYIIPNLTLKAQGIKISEKEGPFLFEAENSKIKVRLLPLFSLKLHINEIISDKINTKLDVEKEFKINENLYNQIQNKIKLDNIKIADLQAKMYTEGTKQEIGFDFKNILYKNKHRYIQANIDGEIFFNNKKSKTNLDILIPRKNSQKNSKIDIGIEDFDISCIWSFIQNYLPKEVQNISGIVNIKASGSNLHGNIQKFNIQMKNPEESIIFPDNLSVNSNFSITKTRIGFDNIDLISDNLKIIVSGSLSNYINLQACNMNINARIDKARAEEIVDMIPGFKVEEIDTYKIKKYKFYGNALGNLTIKGTMPEPDVYGNIYIGDGYLTKRIPNTNSGATIKIKLNGRDTDFDVYVPAGGGENVKVSGNVELYNVKYGDIYVKSSSNVDLHVAETVVNPLHEILNFVIGPVPIMDIYGKGNIDINVKGNRTSPHVWGTLNLNKVKATFNDIPNLMLTNADAKLLFEDEKVIFTEQNSLLNGKDFRISGTCDMDGNFNFQAKSQDQLSSNMYYAVKNSPMLKEISKILPDFSDIKGYTDIDLKIFGKEKFIENVEVGKNAFAAGNIKLKENSAKFQNMEVEGVNGEINYDKNYADIKLKAFSDTQPIFVEGKLREDLSDVIIASEQFDLNKFIKVSQNDINLPKIKFNAKYKGKTDLIEYNKVNIYAKILPDKDKNITYKDGELLIKNNNLILKKLKVALSEKENEDFLSADLKINNVFEPSRDINGYFNLKTKDISILNDIFMVEILPEDYKKVLRDYELNHGKLDLNCSISNNKPKFNTNLDNIAFTYIPLDMPIEILNGALSASNNTIKLEKVNILADKMPILVDGTITDIFNKRLFNLYINSKPKQDFIDKYINKISIYPMKIKGDISSSISLKGAKDNFEVKSEINLDKDSSIYNYGATIGDIENAIKVYLHTKVLNGNTLKIKDFTYNKIVDSQNKRKTILNMIKANGEVTIVPEDLIFKDLIIKTNHPADARLFNIIFRKPNIKEGQFTSDLRLNGKLSSPKVLGNFHIVETNIPFFDTTMKNIELNFKDKIIEISSKGEIMGNDLSFKGEMKNNLVPPYQLENAELRTDSLNFNKIINELKTSQINDVNKFDTLENIDIKTIVLKNFQLYAENVLLRNLYAANVKANINLNPDGVLDIKNFKLDIANGSVHGKYKFNFENNKMNLDLAVNNIDANDITYALFDLNNQIYGDMTGKTELSCTGDNFKKCMETLNGDVKFNVKDGRMPKLGSLEYLLKAGNLIKGGITNLSINGIIDIITPSKTGNFSDIFGNIVVKNGVAETIEIATKGDSLSLFINGKYNFANSYAEMEVLGLLSKKITTMLGTIGNMSVNTLFNLIPGIDLSSNSPLIERINKIPGIELSNKNYRKFIAEIIGNINNDDYVKSFKWIN